jgi:hypothetical protein
VEKKPVFLEKNLVLLLPTGCCQPPAVPAAATLVDKTARARLEMVNLSLANLFGPDPPFRAVTDCKANVELCMLLPSCGTRCPNTWEIIIGDYWGLNCVHDSIVDSILPMHMVVKLFRPSSGRCGQMSCKWPDEPPCKVCANIKPTQLYHHA